MKKICILILLLVCAGMTVCSAADIEVNIDKKTGEVSVSGSPGAGNAEKKMMLYALKEGDVLTGLNSDETQNKTEIFSAIEYCQADSEGNYIFPNVKMRSADGRYIFYVTADHSDATYQSESLYVISESTAKALRDIFENKDAASIKTAIKNNSVKLDTPVLNLIEDDTALEKIAQKLANKEYESNDDIIEAVNKASFEAAMETTVPAAALDMLLYPEKNDSMKEYVELANSVNLMTEKSKLSPYKTLEQLMQADRIKIFESVSKAGYTDTADMFDKINMAVIMYRIQNCLGYGDITGVLSEYQDVIEGFSYSDYSQSVYLNDLNKTLVGESFTKTKELSDYIKKYLADKSAATPPSGGSTGWGTSGGSGSGGGNSSGSSSPIISGNNTGSPVVPPEPVLGNEEEPFTDIGNFGWAKEAINYLSKKGIVSGKGDKLFAPQDNVTREEFVKMIVLAFDLKSADKGEMNFSDVDLGKWYAPYIKTAYNLGIVNGLADNSFGIGSYISRQDMAVMITRAKNIELTDKTSEKKFTDSEQIADYARASVDYLHNAGVINGYDDGSFRPAANVTRAEAAKVLYGLLK